MFDFQNSTCLISQMHFWFPKFARLILSVNVLFSKWGHLISQITLLITKICRFWFPKWHFWFQKFVTFDFQNLSRLISQMAFLISKMRQVRIFSTWQFLRKISPTQGRRGVGGGGVGGHSTVNSQWTFLKWFLSFSLTYNRHYCHREKKTGPNNSKKWLTSENKAT